MFVILDEVTSFKVLDAITFVARAKPEYIIVIMAKRIAKFL